MAWIAVRTEFPTDDKVTVLPVTHRYAALVALLYVKAHGSKGLVSASARQIALASAVEPDVMEETLQECGMFDYDGKTLQVLNWQKFQSDPTSKNRVKKHRALHTVTPVTDRNVTPTPTRTPTPTPTKRGEEPARNPLIVEPTPQEVRDAGELMGYPDVDAEGFVAYYRARGWQHPNNGGPVRDWQAALVGWKRNRHKYGGENKAADMTEAEALELAKGQV